MGRSRSKKTSWKGKRRSPSLSVHGGKKRETKAGPFLSHRKILGRKEGMGERKTQKKKKKKKKTKTNAWSSREKKERGGERGVPSHLATTDSKRRGKKDSIAIS